MDCQEETEVDIKPLLINDDSTDSEIKFKFSVYDEEYSTILENIRANETDVVEILVKSKCKSCPKTFRSEKTLKLHEGTHIKSKPKVKVFICEVCGKNLQSAGSLTIHKRIHSGFKFSCEHCPKSFTQKSGLDIHLQIHRGEFNFSCHICKKKFRQKQALQHHLVHRHRVGEFRFFCNICNKGFAERGSLNIHSVIHDNSTFYECVVCSQNFKHKSSLVRHNNTHFKNTECTLCPVPRKFRYQTFLQKHLLGTHNVELVEPEEFPEQKPQELLVIHEQTMQIVNVMNYETLMELNQPKIEDIPVHMEKYENVQDEYLIFEDEEEEEEVPEQIEPVIDEPVIDQIMRDVSTDINVRKVIDDELSKIQGKDQSQLEFQCHLCEKQFSRKYYLNRHLKNHEKNTEIICDICGKKLKSALSLHMKAVHYDIRPYCCDICNKTFREKNRLRMHLMVHTKEHAFECKICSKTFRHLQNFKNHFKKHAGIKNFVCNICGRGFIENGSLKSHMVVHEAEKKFQCPKCLKKIRRATTYKLHIKSCDGPLITNCVDCKKSFRYESFLKTHILSLHPHQTYNPYYKKLFCKDTLKGVVQ